MTLARLAIRGSLILFPMTLKATDINRLPLSPMSFSDKDRIFNFFGKFREIVLAPISVIPLSARKSSSIESGRL